MLKLKINNMKPLHVITVLFLILAFPISVRASVLAPDQQDWLEKHKNTIIVRPEKNYPPFSFISSGGSTKPKGLAVDYIDLITRKIGAQNTYLEAKSRSSILSDLKAGKEGVILALSTTEEKEDYLYFSEPFINISAVIVTRKDSKYKGDKVSLADFNSKEVAITDGYAVMDYVTSNYPKIIIDSVTDDEVALQKLLLGEVEAAVMDLASLSYYTSKDMLSYVSVVGQTGFDYELSFAVPKSMPDLQLIINSGLKEITPSEHSVIKDKWITFPSTSEKPKGIFSSLYRGTSFWLGISIVGAIIIVVLLVLIIVHTKRHHSLHLASISRAKQKERSFNELNSQLKELEEASAVLGENMQEIKSLEKTIQNKIEHIQD
jgi:ABC-type amino acid transport substrate-binding protein